MIFSPARLSRGEPLPQWLLPLRDRAAAFAGLSPDDIVQALLIRYDAGAGIGWHKDRPIYEHVIGVSLGAPTHMRFRRPKEGGWSRISVPLQPRGIYHLAGEARQDWEHSIADLDRTRYSVTLRTFSQSGRRKTADMG